MAVTPVQGHDQRPVACPVVGLGDVEEEAGALVYGLGSGRGEHADSYVGRRLRRQLIEPSVQLRLREVAGHRWHGRV